MIKINPINFAFKNSKINNTAKNNRLNQQYIKNDTFVSSKTNITFKGNLIKEKEDFIQKQAAKIKANAQQIVKNSVDIRHKNERIFQNGNYISAYKKSDKIIDEALSLFSGYSQKIKQSIDEFKYGKSNDFKPFKNSKGNTVIFRKPLTAKSPFVMLEFDNKHRLIQKSFFDSTGSALIEIESIDADKNATLINNIVNLDSFSVSLNYKKRGPLDICSEQYTYEDGILVEYFKDYKFQNENKYEFSERYIYDNNGRVCNIEKGCKKNFEEEDYLRYDERTWYNDGEISLFVKNCTVAKDNKTFCEEIYQYNDEELKVYTTNQQTDETGKVATFNEKYSYIPDSYKLSYYTKNGKNDETNRTFNCEEIYTFQENGDIARYGEGYFEHDSSLRKYKHLFQFEDGNLMDYGKDYEDTLVVEGGAAAASETTESKAPLR